MSVQTRPAAAILAAAVLLGVLADALLRARGAWGVNFFLWVVAVVVAAAFLVRGRGPVGSETRAPETRALVVLAVLFSAGLAWRDSTALKLLDLWAVALLLSLAAFRATGWLRRAGVSEYGLALASSGVHAAIGTPLLIGEVDWKALPAGDRQARWLRLGGATLRGVAIAAPVVLVFSALLMSADAVFASLVTRTLRIDVASVVEHIVPIAFIAWVVGGYLRRFVGGPQFRWPPGVVGAFRRPAIGVVEIGVALALVDLLFIAFLAVQLRYFFGGAELVEVTPGLTYAEYARRGFFELVAVAALVLPVLLLADWVLRRERPRDEWVFRLLTGAQLVLLFAIMASAVQRMRLYQEVYGMTELRFYTMAFMIWLAAIFVWFAATVLRGRRDRFAFGALVAGLTAIAVLHSANPDARIVTTNARRAAAGLPFDAQYAGTRSADAAPALLAALDDLPPTDACRAATLLLTRWSPESDRDWRSWSWATARARSAVALAEPRLRRLAAGASSPADCGVAAGR